MAELLFVDDNPAFLKSVCRLLHRQTEWNLHFAHSSDEAQAYLENHFIDLMICDVLMPEKSGLELLDSIRRNPDTATIPVIMATGQIESDVKQKALELGAVDLLSKPFEKTELEARISNSLQLKHFQDQIIIQNQALEEEKQDWEKYTNLVSQITSALVKSQPLDVMLQDCCQAIVRHIGAAFARIWILNHKENQLELTASAGIYTHLNGDHQQIPMGEFKIGRIAKSKTPHLTNEVIGDPQIHNQTWAKKKKMVSFAGHPLIAEGRVVGVMALFSKFALKESILTVLSSVADGIAVGITQKKLVDQAHFYSFYDPLTLLPNRKFFYVFMGKMIHYANRYLQKFALILIDIDGFNKVNENLGHTVGDNCLKIISKRLSGMLRDSDNLARLSTEEMPIARMGGDEFAILLQNATDIDPLQSVMKRMNNEIARKIHLAGRDLTLTASAGVAIYPDHGDSIANLFKNAETALYFTKREGRNNHAIYSTSMNSRSLEIFDLELDLRNAVNEKKFCLHYQPKVDLKTRTLVGAEALIRWEKEPQITIPPSQFIPIAEETGLIIPIGDWVMSEACRQNTAWLNAGIPQLPLAVNVSGLQFGQEAFIQKISRLMESSQIPAALFEIEITETSLMLNPEVSLQNLHQLHEMGIKIALDDFGTGYSSLSYLQKLPIDLLKIDISFIRNLLTNPNDAVMVKTIISMAHNLGLKVVAEGVETPPQLEFLASHGCDIIQGYLFSRPLPPDQFEAFLKKGYTFS